jgi:hypothetical protein
VGVSVLTFSPWCSLGSVWASRLEPGSCASQRAACGNVLSVCLCMSLSVSVSVSVSVCLSLSLSLCERDPAVPVLRFSSPAQPRLRLHQGSPCGRMLPSSGAIRPAADLLQTRYRYAGVTCVSSDCSSCTMVLAAAASCSRMRAASALVRKTCASASLCSSSD